MMKIYLKSIPVHKYQTHLDLKKQILLFDKIMLFKPTYDSAEKVVFHQSIDEELKSIASFNFQEIEYLHNNNLLDFYHPDTLTKELLRGYDLDDDLPEPFATNINLVIKEIEQLRTDKTKVPDFVGVKIQDIKNIEKHTDLSKLNAYHSLYSRLYAMIYCELTNEDYIPEFINVKHNEIPGVRNTHTIAAVLINKLPSIDPSASWEEILEYKSDKDIQRKYYALINWINEIVRSNLTISEINDKFEFLYREYEYQLRLHKTKKGNTTFQIVLNSPLETLENLVKLKFGSLLNPLFKISKSNSDLLDAESKITGRELGYIFDIQNKFGI